VAVLAEAHFLLHGWLRSGNCGTARGVVEFLKEALALLPERHAIRVVRADAGFFDQQLLGFLEQRGLFYIVVARLTLVAETPGGQRHSVACLGRVLRAGEFFLQLYGWDRPRRFVVIREQLRAERIRWEENCWMFLATPSASSSPTFPCQSKNLARLQPQGGYGKSHRRTKTRSGGG